MIEMPQLATLMVAAVFSAVLFVSGQIFNDYRSAKSEVAARAVMVATRVDAMR
ncbi:hypothetical protein JQ604_16270 [Bradyrhizobium jicamae]|uniref:hypothetical protein n=1 Tax=Bradyrhizobium jicamae TaxID=280332 RepID=UPI001BA650DF|nr:hypothetical protein [Bradyrhizobium jicamae]MBR0753744.1 hypothetical protein [Bradyrhizobium jicamae]